MRNTLLFLKSKSATYNSDTKFYRWNFINPIQARKDEQITIQAIEAEFPVSYYNVDSTNNVLELIVVTDDTEDSSTTEDYSETYTLTLPPQNYSASQIATEITSSQTHSSIACSFSKRTGKMTITATASTNEPSDAVEKITIGANTTCNKLIGFNTGQTITQPTLGNLSLEIEGDNVVDLNKTTNVYIETDLLLETRNTNGEKSGILAKVQINKPFLSLVHYQTSHTLPIQLGRKDTYLDHIDLRFVDDENQSIEFNGDNDFSITLLFNFEKKDKLLLGEEIVTNDIIPIIDNINTGDSCDEYSDNEIE